MVETYFGYFVETAYDQRTERMLRVMNKTLGAGVTVEVPYTNFLAKLDLDRMMTRDVPPLRLKLEHFWSGQNDIGWSTAPRNAVADE